MAAKTFIDDISVNTIIGPGTYVNGGISTPGFLKIDGDVNGDLVSKGRIVVSENARVCGNVRATAVVVGGIIKGDVIASESIDITSSGMVIGDIITRRLKVAENVLIHGFCYARNDKVGFEDAEKFYKNRQALENIARVRGK